MILDDAIKRYSSNAFYEKSDGNLQGYLEFNQLAEWLKELKQLRENTGYYKAGSEEVMDKYEMLKKNIYDICIALVAIVDTECCTYGFDTEVKMAEDYIKDYEEDHPDGKKT